jgi:hypothetical protein
MKIHCIHDPTSKERKELVDKEIELHGLEIQFWPAIYDQLRPFVGISKAHKQIVKWARNSRLPCVCIAEDDFHLTAPGAWEFFLENIPVDYDLYLSGIYHGLIVDHVVKDFCALHLYIVHSRFYETFLSCNEMNHLDRELCNKGKFVVCEPFAAIQHDGYSIHKKKETKYGHLLRGRSIFLGK